MEFQWYVSCAPDDHSLQQGDFIPECPIVIPPEVIMEGVDVEIDIQNIDSIILSQSCDLVHGKVEIVLVCPFLPMKDWLKQRPAGEQSRGAIQKAVKELQKGHFPGYHLLNKEQGIWDDYQVVDFKNVYGVNYRFLSSLVKDREERIRLLPPYREHLSQAFARYFMRVGLPQDLRIDDRDFWPLND